MDAGYLRPMYHPVVRALCTHLPLNSDDKELLARWDRKEALDVDQWREILWGRINTHPVGEEGIPRLLSALLSPNKPMDWFGAEMVILWARHEGVSEDAICTAFGMDVPPHT